MDHLLYPPPPRSDTAEDHFGDLVADPFRPLEDLDAPSVKAWIAAENDLCESVLAAWPSRETIRQRVTALWDYPKAGVPFERGGRWFQARNTGLQNQGVLYVGDQPDDVTRVLIDPNLFSDDGTVSLTGIGVKPDGSAVAYATSRGGSDWVTWRVRDVISGVDTDDVVEWSKFSGAAWHDDGFFYGAPERPGQGDELVEETRTLRILYHRIGTGSDQDLVVYEPQEADWLPHAQVTDDGRFLVITISRGTGTQTHVLVKDLHGPADGPLLAITKPFEAKVYVVANSGPTLYLLTDFGAQRSRVVRTEFGSAQPDAWVDVIPEGVDNLTEAQVCSGQLVCHYLHNAHSTVEVFDLDGSPVRSIPLPGLVSLEAGVLGHGVIEGRPDSEVIYYKVVSFTESGAIWSHHLPSGEGRLLSASAAAFDPSRYVTRQVFAPSADGTDIPMFVTHRSDAVADGDHPVLLYGYGGFDVPLTPSFGITFAAWLEGGGTLAVANLRGGGEFGPAWHDAGRLERKQNVFDDFCGCARWLCESGWSRPQRIAINGGSNGGLLVGACLTQHPELFGAAVAEVGVLDMLRFHLWTIGWAWKSDYGDPEVEDQYRTLRSYSPLHNISNGRCYPPTLIMTGDHDDRVVPSHSLKFAAALQEAQGCDQPVLLRVSTSAGHGLGKPTSKLIAEATDRLVFLERIVGKSGISD